MDALQFEPDVTLQQAEYDELIRDQKILNALRNAGVDNWEWYDEALSSLGDE